MVEHYGLGYLQGGYSPLAEEAEEEPFEAIAEPDLSVEIDFIHDINPDTAPPDPTWTEIVHKIRSPQGFTIHRGRQRQLDRNEAGRLTLYLDDPDGELDPDNPDSPYFPNVYPRRRIRVGALTESTLTPFEVGESEVGGDDVVGGGPGLIRTGLFDGLIDGYAYDYPSRGLDAAVTITAYDALGAMSRETFDLDTFVVDGDVFPNPERFARDLMAEIVEFVPFITDTDIPAGGLRVNNTVYADANVLAELQALAQGDGGNLFASRDGVLTYLPPEWAFRPVDEQLRFGPSLLKFIDVDFVYDTANVYNDVTVTSATATSIVQDAPSIRRYGLNSITLSLPIELAEDVDARAESFLAQYTEAHKVILRLDLSNIVSEWEAILGAELWDKVLLRVTFPNGDIRDQESLLEGIDLGSPSRINWQPVWWLSLAPFENLVPAVSGDFETEGDTGDWVAETNCTLEQTSAFGGRFASRGAGALLMRAIADGDMSARSPSIIGVDGRASYRASCNVGAGAFGIGGSQVCHMELEWRDDADALLSTLVGDDVSVRRFRFGLLSVSGRAPSAATQARIRVYVEDAPESTSELISTSVDEVSLRRTS